MNRYEAFLDFLFRNGRLQAIMFEQYGEGVIADNKSRKKGVKFINCSRHKVIRQNRSVTRTERSLASS